MALKSSGRNKGWEKRFDDKSKSAKNVQIKLIWTSYQQSDDSQGVVDKSIKTVPSDLL